MLGQVHIGGIPQTINQNIIVQLSDIAGTGRFVIKDRDGAIVFSVDSQGTVRARGQYQRV